MRVAHVVCEGIYTVVLNIMVVSCSNCIIQQIFSYKWPGDSRGSNHV